MARKEKFITLKDGEQNLSFVVRQMPLTRLEMFALRLVSLLAGSASGAPDFEGLSEGLDWLRGQSAKALLSCLGNLDTDKAAPLLDELLGCCSRVVGQVETKCTPETIDGYLSDLRTLFELRKEAFSINFGFFIEGAEKRSGSRKNTPGAPPPSGTDTPPAPTSPDLRPR
jgi:hypothetical protein